MLCVGCVCLRGGEGIHSFYHFLVLKKILLHSQELFRPKMKALFQRG